MARPSTPWYRSQRDQWYTRVNGKQIALGVTGADNHAAAVAALETLLKQMRPPDPPTVGEAVASFLAGKVGRVKPRTVTTLRWACQHLVAALGTLRVDRVACQELEAASCGRGWSDDTRRNFLNVCEQVLKSVGVKLRTDKPPRGSAGAKALIPERVYLMALGAAWGDLRPLLVVLWNTGARPGEVTGLKAEDVDWPNACATLREHKTAHRGKTRVLVFNDAALAALEGQRAKYPDGGLLFRTRKGNRYAPDLLACSMVRISKRIGHRVTAYGCRHTFITAALAAGVPDATVAAMAGHSSTAMIHKSYNHLSSQIELLRAVATKVRPAA